MSRTDSRLKVMHRIDEAHSLIYEKIKLREIYCEYCKRQIKRVKPSIAWKWSKKIRDRGWPALTEITNLRYVRFYHPSCVMRGMKVFWNKKDN